MLKVKGLTPNAQRFMFPPLPHESSRVVTMLSVKEKNYFSEGI